MPGRGWESFSQDLRLLGKPSASSCGSTSMEIADPLLLARESLKQRRRGRELRSVLSTRRVELGCRGKAVPQKTCCGQEYNMDRVLTSLSSPSSCRQS